MVNWPWTLDTAHGSKERKHIRDTRIIIILLFSGYHMHAVSLLELPIFTFQYKEIFNKIYAKAIN